MIIRLLRRQYNRNVTTESRIERPNKSKTRS